MKNLIKKLGLAIRELCLKFQKSPLWSKIFFIVKNKSLLAYQKIRTANQKMVEHSQHRLENLIQRVSRNKELTLSFKATQIQCAFVSIQQWIEIGRAHV